MSKNISIKDALASPGYYACNVNHSMFNGDAPGSSTRNSLGVIYFHDAIYKPGSKAPVVNGYFTTVSRGFVLIDLNREKDIQILYKITNSIFNVDQIISKHELPSYEDLMDMTSNINVDEINGLSAHEVFEKIDPDKLVTDFIKTKMQNEYLKIIVEQLYNAKPEDKDLNQTPDYTQSANQWVSEYYKAAFKTPSRRSSTKERKERPSTKFVPDVDSTINVEHIDTVTHLSTPVGTASLNNTMSLHSVSTDTALIQEDRTLNSSSEFDNFGMNIVTADLDERPV